ncbi:DUF1702 family protein [Actinomycetes bacterium KLBMP 9797]
MGSTLRALRRRLITPDASEASLDKRGFHTKGPARRELLENVGQIFLSGYGDAVETRTVAELEERLERIPRQFRGFAYEGAAMGLAVLDGLPFGGRRRTADLLAGPGDRHIYMVYVGIGWAMARLPRFRWPAASTLDPLLRWLVLDGYGFHQAYFHTARYVHEQYQDPAFRWPADATRWYANHAIDQGIGRALWFVGGADPARVVTLLERFPEQRRADLFAGVGLAATYAGGVGGDDLAALSTLAGGYRPVLAQGAAFAAEARVRAGLVLPHTGAATAVLCGTTPDRAAEITQELRPAQPVDGQLPAYEAWRRSIAGAFVSLGGVRA